MKDVIDIDGYKWMLLSDQLATRGVADETLGIVTFYDLQRGVDGKWHYLRSVTVATSQLRALGRAIVNACK